MTNFNKKNKLFKPFITAVTVIFLISSLGTGSYATILPSLVEPGTLMSLSEPFNGPALLGIQIFPQDPLKFSFILGQGERPLDETSVRAISEKSIRYFLAGLAIPEQDLWVNLSPYESDRIISDVLGKTEIGQDMLAQDYILKQLAASLTYPESDLGKKFWDTVTQRARERFGNVDIPMDIFNKVWIIPDHSVVYETTDRAVVAEAKLKVLLEQDYFALQQNAPGKSSDNEPNPIAQEVMREIVIPLLEKEVNEGSHFAPLRQIFHALILSSWFKDKLKMNAVAQVYGNQKKISGIVSPDLQAVEQVYQEYLKAYQIGAYDYIKEEAVTENGEVVPRRYFSGGEVWKNVSKTRTDVALLSKDEFTRRISPILGKNPLRADARLNPLTRPASRDTAMLVSIKTAGASDPNIGKSRLIEIKKALFDPKLARLKATLQSLDYLYEALETLYQKDARWKHWMDYFRDRLHPQKIAARKILRVLIQQIKTDFEEQSAGAAEDFQYDFKERLPKILDPDDVEAFIQATVGSISLYSIVERIMNNPYSLPRIPATPDARHIVEHLNRKVAVTQRWKFQDAFNLIQRELMDYATRTQGEEQTIAFGYLAYLMEAHKNVTEGTANAFTNQVISVARAEVRKQLHLDPNASEDLLVERIRQSARAAVNMLLDGRPITSPTTNADVEISDDLDEQIVNE
ncbi:MAG TPA: hypothetical protein VLJ10_02315, partial [Candidatus Bathyarchaeia archaeon]|nr:hypothetical protein [Candidatus Bathyarchaeia archaeon]